jgi:hypothetical protein
MNDDACIGDYRIVVFTDRTLRVSPHSIATSLSTRVNVIPTASP